MKKAESLKELAISLAKAQSEFTHAVFDKKGNFGKYASLESVIDSVRPVLTKHGLSILQTVKLKDQLQFLETTLLHISGEYITCQCPLIVDKQNMQGLGSAITYARRYSITSLVFIASDDDDDGQVACKTPSPQQRSQVQENNYSGFISGFNNLFKNEPDIQAAVRNFLITQFGKSSLKELTQNELVSLKTILGGNSVR